MELIAKIMGIAFSGAVISVFLKEKTPQFSMIISLATGIVILLLVGQDIKEVILHLKNMVSSAGMDKDSVTLVLKICGIGIVAEYFTNVISDAGEAAIAKKAEFAAKIVIFVMILPLLGKVVDTVWTLF
ncbi:MAG: stage III sporulation protein AD [Clostridia bacterium]|nr:stage III sporulation protein AD [Clostridia bacterium]